MNKKGLTLVELMITVAVSAIVLAGIVTFWGMASKNWTAERLKSLMQQQIEVGIERMKKEIRISTADPEQMVFYGDPNTINNPPYEAISFPLPKYTDEVNRIIDMTGGSINWGTTVIYHVYTDEKGITELRRTVFNNRADLTKSQRETQLSAVVAAGNGVSACQGSEASITETVFTNLVSLEIEGSAKFDGYNSSTTGGILSNNVEFGSILLTPGTHNVKFQIIGQNPLSSGYGLGVDFIRLTPSGNAAREGEDYDGTAVCYHGEKSVEDMFNNTNGVWSGNYHIEFSSSSSDSYITIPIYYDEWRETNFDNGNISWDHTQRDQTAGHNYIIRLEGNDTTWRASDQTGADKADDPLVHSNEYIRVVISEDCLTYSGSAARVRFSSHSVNPLKITSAYFGIRDGETSNFSGTPVPLSFGTPPSADILISSGSSVQCNWFELVLGGIPPTINKDADPEVDYLVSFHVQDDMGNAYCAKWNTDDTSVVNSYIGTGIEANPIVDNWIGATQSEDIFAVEDVFVSYVAEGTCTSQIYDTKVDSDNYPQYKTLSNITTLPSDTSVIVEAQASDDPDMSIPTSWTTALSGMDGKRYVQFRATLASTTFPYESTPKGESVYLNWNPTEATKETLVDVSGYFTMRPDYGIFKILIDDKELIRGISVTMKIEESVLSSSYKSQHSVEVYPRNTGK